jgi:hypothetical protein
MDKMTEETAVQVKRLRSPNINYARGNYEEWWAELLGLCMKSELFTSDDRIDMQLLYDNRATKKADLFSEGSLRSVFYKATALGRYAKKMAQLQPRFKIDYTQDHLHLMREENQPAT